MSEFSVGVGNAKGNNRRLEKLDEEGKTSNRHLFRVFNELTEVETMVPGGAISRFLNQDYTVTYIGLNQPGVLVPTKEELETTKAIEDAAEAGMVLITSAKNKKVKKKDSEVEVA